ncbi:MAG: hypothetical protein LBP50_10655 [Tannerella sp.]|jgi:hypothetical protein|nr:hypothetical protein [Tannerella sp.]
MNKPYWDYIPKKDSELVPWSANFTAGITANAAAWNITPEEVKELQTADASFAALQAQADSPVKNAVTVAKKNAARKALVAKIRGLAGFRLKNPVITDAQRVALGLHVRDTNPSNISIPPTRPELDIAVIDFRRLKVLFRDMGSSSKAKPRGISGAVIAYAVLAAPPAGPDALTRTVLATRTPYILEFTGEERGKTVYIAVCWQNSKGQRGPWSEIGNAIVP